jgi:NADPH-dependent glutamate synthase beta subunit-like oxidoreductase
MNELRKQYSGVVYAIGAQQNNEPSWFKKWKETSNLDKTVLNARDVVYWYNNHPKYEAYQLDLTNKRNVVIIGNGNVAIDISRILLKDPAELVNTEISENALKALLESKIRNVTLIGRRGFTHSAFALK